MYCPKCGKVLENDVNFCGNCGAKIGAHNIAINKNVTPLLAKKNASIIVNPKHKKLLLFAIIGPLACIILLFITKVQIKTAYGMQVAEFGILDYFNLKNSVNEFNRTYSSTSGATNGVRVRAGDGAVNAGLMPMIMGILILCIVVVFSKAIYSVYLAAYKNQPLKFKSLTVIQIIFIVFFSISMILCINVFNYLNNGLRSSGSSSLNIFGWIYIILSIATIVHLFKLKSKYKKGELA